MNWTGDIHQGETRQVMERMPAASIHMAMTSPPYYGLRDYGVDGQIGLEASLDEFIETMVDVGRSVRRVLRPDGSWWVNLGDAYNSGRGDHYPRDRTDEQRDEQGYVQRGVFGGMPYKSKMLMPQRVAIALADDGWVVRNDVVWRKPNPMPQSVTDRLSNTFEFVFHLTPEPRYWYNLLDIREPYADSSLRRDGRAVGENKWTPGVPGQDGAHTVAQPTDERNSLHPAGKNPGDVFDVSVKPYEQAHFATYPPDLCTKPIKATCPPKVCAECGAPYDRDVEVKSREVAGGTPTVDDAAFADRQGNYQGDRDGYTQPTAYEVGPWEPTCECGAGSEPGIVLDPFAGSGTTLLEAKRLGRRFVGIELNADYVALAQQRVGVTVDEPDRLHTDGQRTVSEWT